MNKNIKHILITTTITAIIGLCLSKQNKQLSESVRITQEIIEKNREKKIQDSINFSQQQDTLQNLP